MLLIKADTSQNQTGLYHLGIKPENIDLKNSPILKIRSGVQGEDKLRVVLELSKSLKAKSMSLKKTGSASDRLVIDLRHGEHSCRV